MWVVGGGDLVVGHKLQCCVGRWGDLVVGHKLQCCVGSWGRGSCSRA